MLRKSLMAAAAVMLMAGPALAQQLDGAAGNDAAAVRQYHRATNHHGTMGRMRTGRSSSMGTRRSKMAPPAQAGTYGGTQIPGHGGGSMGQ